MVGSVLKWNKVLLFAIIVWGVAWAALAIYTKQGTFPHGFLWGEWKIAGMREADFRKELELRVEALLQSRIRFELPEGIETSSTTTARSGATGSAAGAAAGATVGAAAGAGRSTFSLAELGVSVDTAQLDTAAERLFRGSMLKRAQARLSMRGMRAPLALRVSSTAPLRAIGALWPQLLQARPQEARRVITADDKVGYIPGKSAVQVDADALTTELGSVAERLFRALTAAPQPTGLHSSTAAFLKLAPESKQLSEPTIIVLPIQTIAPTITVDTLKTEGIDRKIAEFSTFFPTSGEGRKHNIRSTA
ncbi:MAG: VanW family protein, partial [Paenibacillus sp.]|nr:VanW family protein [Paenibacillus sp.]